MKGSVSFMDLKKINGSKKLRRLDLLFYASTHLDGSFFCVQLKRLSCSSTISAFLWDNQLTAEFSVKYSALANIIEFGLEMTRIDLEILTYSPCVSVCCDIIGKISL